MLVPMINTVLKSLSLTDAIVAIVLSFTQCEVTTHARLLNASDWSSLLSLPLGPS